MEVYETQRSLRHERVCLSLSVCVCACVCVCVCVFVLCFVLAGT